LQQPALEVPPLRLLRHDPQPESCQPLVQLLSEPFGFTLLLEHRYHVVGVADQARIAATAPLEPSFEPQVQHVVQIDVRQQRAEWASLRHPLARPSDHPVLHHAGFKPFVQQTDQSPIVRPMPYELPQPLVVDRGEEARQAPPAPRPAPDAAARSRVGDVAPWAGCGQVGTRASSPESRLRTPPRAPTPPPSAPADLRSC